MLELCDDNKTIMEFFRFANTLTKKKKKNKKGRRKMKHREKYGSLTHLSYCFEIGKTNSCCICQLLASHQSPSNYHIVVYCTHIYVRNNCKLHSCNKINDFGYMRKMLMGLQRAYNEKRKSLVICIFFFFCFFGIIGPILCIKRHLVTFAFLFSTQLCESQLTAVSIMRQTYSFCVPMRKSETRSTQG